MVCVALVVKPALALTPSGRQRRICFEYTCIMSYHNMSYYVISYYSILLYIYKQISLSLSTLYARAASASPGMDQ